MKIALIALVIVAVIGGAVALQSGSKNDQPQTAGASTETQSLGQNMFMPIAEDMQRGAALIDVRTPEEFAEAHIEGAINLPLADIEAGTYPEVDKSQMLYVYCRSGNRSAQATQLLLDAGYTTIADLGAMSDLVAGGAPQSR